MPISPDHLPLELHYIIPLAERHGTEARVQVFDHSLGRHVMYAEKLTEKAIDTLRTLYSEVSAKDHGPLINRWHHASWKKVPPDTTWPVFGLLILFSQLSELGIAPFNDGRVRPLPTPEPELDWNKLPKPLRYLAGLAEVYGSLQFDDPIFEFLETRMTAEERAELQALSQRYYGEDWVAIKRWLDEYSMTEHREAALVYFTGHLLAHGHDAGLL